VGLEGDAAVTLRMLNEHLEHKTDRSFLKDAQEKMQDWRKLLRGSANKPGKPMKPQAIAQALGQRLAPDAIVVSDSGHNTGLCARHIELTDKQMYGSPATWPQWPVASPMRLPQALPSRVGRWLPLSVTAA
jgi:thiamine pyrophosphate-dependent acetolactate synthase large subunit-like protein